MFQLKSQGIKDSRLRIGVKILVSEVTVLGENPKSKISFDHHKSMFGLLVMLCSIASQYKYASFSTFKKLKVHFLYTHDMAIRHWSMLTPSPGLYIMTKEQKVDVIEDFERKAKSIVPFMNFMITLGIAAEDTMKVLLELNEEHSNALEETCFESSNDRATLLDLVQPIVVRLNENKYTSEVADGGPKSPRG